MTWATWVRNGRRPAPSRRLARRPLWFEELEARNLLAVPSPAFLTGLYQDLLQREPDPAEVAAWVNFGLDSSQVIQSFLASQEYQTNQITQNYLEILGRQPDPSEVAYWLQQMQTGMSSAEVTAAFLASTEFFQDQGGTVADWLTGVYQTVLDRPPDVGGLASWMSNLQGSGGSLLTVALGITNSTEEQEQQIAAAYEELLGRPPDPEGLAYWAALMGQGLTQEQMIAGIIASPEYASFQNGVQPSVGTSSPTSPSAPTSTGNPVGGPGLATGSPDDTHVLGGIQAGSSGTSAGQEPSTSAGTGSTATGTVSPIGTPSGDTLRTGTGQTGTGRTTLELITILIDDTGSDDTTSSANDGAASNGGGVNPASPQPRSNPGGGGTDVTSSGAGTGDISDRNSPPLVTPLAPPTSPGSNIIPGTNGNRGGDNPKLVGSQDSPGLVVVGAPGKISAGNNVNTSQRIGNQNEATVAANPLNPANIVVASNDESAASTSGGIFYAFSMDNGKTWTTSTVGNGSGNLPLACCDPRLLFDRFGNLYLVYLDLNSSQGSHVLLSTNGGQTFTLLATIAQAIDQPAISVGPGSAGFQGSVWITARATGTLIAVGAGVNGLGQIAPFGAVQPITGTASGNFGDIAVGPTGQVFVTWQDLSSFDPTTGLGPGPETILGALDPDGLGPTPISAAFPVTGTNVGWADLVPLISNNFGVDAEANLSWDVSNGPFRGRLYMVYLDEPLNESNDMDVFLRYSDTNGLLWSPPLRVNNDSTPFAQILPTIAVDPITGWIAISWYDGRNDPGSGPGDTNGIPNDDAQFWATMSIDGGQSFMPNVRVSKGTSNSAASEPPPAGLRSLGYGDYMDMDMFNGVAYAVWADNSNSTGNNADGTLARLEIMVAQVIVGRPQLPDDLLEPNETSDKALNFGPFPGLVQTFVGLTINYHSNLLPDYDWYRWTAPASGMARVTINYDSPEGGDLHLRLFTLDSGGFLIPLGASLNLGVSTQTVKVSVPAGKPILAWVYGFDHLQANYSLVLSPI